MNTLTNPPQVTTKSTKLALVLLLVILGLLGGGIIAALRAAQAHADEMNCCNHMKDLAVEMRIYELDNGDTFPPLNKWCDALVENVTNQPTSRTLSFRCPSASKKQTCGFSINMALNGVKNASRIPGDTVVLFESDAGWNGVGFLTNAVARHYGPRLWIGFADGSVRDVRQGELSLLRWIPVTNTVPEREGNGTEE